MSQIYKDMGGSPAPDIETLTGNSGGPVGPDGSFNINILGDNGIDIVGNPGTNTLTVSIQNADTATVTTTNATPTTLMTIPVTTTGTYTFEARVSAYSASGPSSAGFSLFSSARNQAGTVTIIDDTDKITHKDGNFDGATLGVDAVDVNFVASGTNVLIQVTGIAATTINWGGFAAYVFIGV